MGDKIRYLQRFSLVEIVKREAYTVGKFFFFFLHLIYASSIINGFIRAIFFFIINIISGEREIDLVVISILFPFLKNKIFVMTMTRDGTEFQIIKYSNFNAPVLPLYFCRKIFSG